MDSLRKLKSWFKNLSPMKKLLIGYIIIILTSLFQSVNLRTAGFTTVSVDSITGSGRMIMLILMMIGGSPGSTAGGMKTTTTAVCLCYI